MQYNKIILFLLLISSVSSAKFDPKLMHFKASDINSITKKIIITFIIPEKDFIYKDFIHCSVHEPQVTLSPWKEDKQSIDYYDPVFNETKQIFNENFSIIMTATLSTWDPEPIHLYCSYYRKSDKKIHHRLFTFAFTEPMETNSSSDEIEETQLINTRISPHHKSLLDIYAIKFNTMIHQGIDHFNYYSSLYFYLLLLFIFLFCIGSHYCKQHIQQYHILKEILVVIQLSLSVIAIGYIHLHFISRNFFYANVWFAWLSTISFGYLYIKKSTQNQLRALGTFYTFFGILLIAGSFILLFKAVQFY